MFHLTQPWPLRWLMRLLLAMLAGPSVRNALVHHQPAVVVVCHPLLADVAVRARRRTGHRCAVVVVVTDLASAHRTWWHPNVDHTLTPSAQLLRSARRFAAARPDPRPVGVPIGAAFRRGAATVSRSRLRAELGLRPGRFLVLVTSGGEGGRGLRQWTRTVLDGSPAVDVVVICGRNEVRRRQLTQMQRQREYQGRLRVTGLVDNMADWLRCADVVVTKAGPSIICEAMAVGAPLLLAGHLPGQEAGNIDYAEASGAARDVRGHGELLAELDELRRDPERLARRRAAAYRHGVPDAAERVSDVLVRIAQDQGASVPAEEPATSVRAPSSAGSVVAESAPTRRFVPSLAPSRRSNR